MSGRSYGISVRLWIGALLVSAVAIELISHAKRVDAQVKPGEFALFQPGISNPVGWARINSDRTVEWWAYIEGSYTWADNTNTPSSRWHLEAEYDGPGSYASYAAWRADVLQRAAAQGHTVTFQNHTVTEDTVAN